MIDDALLDDWRATIALVKRLRAEVEREPIVATAKGGGRMNPAAIVLREQQTHMRGLARLLTKRKAEDTHFGEEELRELLDA